MPLHARLSNAWWDFVMFDRFPSARRRFFGMSVLLAGGPELAPTADFAIGHDRIESHD
jgi:hypothetical protein